MHPSPHGLPALHTLQHARGSSVAAGRTGWDSWASRGVRPSRHSAAYARAAGAANARFVAGRAEALPLSDAAADCLLTNGVVNLSPQKPRVASELFRVLRPGGRLSMADVLLADAVDDDLVARLGTWSD